MRNRIIYLYNLSSKKNEKRNGFDQQFDQEGGYKKTYQESIHHDLPLINF